MDDKLIPYLVPLRGLFSQHVQPVERLYEAKGFLKPGIIYAYIRRCDKGDREIQPHQIYWLNFSCDEYEAMGLSVSAENYRLAMAAPKRVEYRKPSYSIK